jgi:hypothetical protein
LGLSNFFSFGGKRRTKKPRTRKGGSKKRRNTRKNVKKTLNNLKKQALNMSYSQAISG